LDLNHLRELLELVREHDLSEFEIEHEGLRLKVRKNGSVQGTPVAPTAPLTAAVPTGPASPIPPAPPAVAPSAVPPPAADESEIELAVVKSPIVGTFYRSPEPGAASFVDVGTAVKKGQILCIIEAMKLMNEIESEYDGEIANIYVDNGQAVQYGERLFAIRIR
jgi:acetyl-CoA carboxylase biotin carboxyl carrier protein